MKKKRTQIEEIKAYNKLKRQLEGAMIKGVDGTPAGRALSRRMAGLWRGFSEAEKREADKRYTV